MAARNTDSRGEQPGTERKREGRRKLLAALAAGGGGTLLTQQWAKPIVDLVIVPLHAQASQTPQCPTSGTFTCGGVTFTASAIFIAGVQCKGGPAFQGGGTDTSCCANVVWKKPLNGSHRARLTIQHNSPNPLQVTVNFYTIVAVGCTNDSTFGDTATNTIPGNNVPFVYNGNINGDFPECVGFRIYEVKTATGTEVCKPVCATPRPNNGDLGLFATILAADAVCPP